LLVTLEQDRVLSADGDGALSLSLRSRVGVPCVDLRDADGGKTGDGDGLPIVFDDLGSGVCLQRGDTAAECICDDIAVGWSLLLVSKEGKRGQKTYLFLVRR
jgi:hypothetical protein